jgi:hypothetical protein
VFVYGKGPTIATAPEMSSLPFEGGGGVGVGVRVGVRVAHIGGS